MASAPLSPWHRANLHRHAEPIALVVAGASHARVIPWAAEVLRAPRHVGLEAAASEHHRARADFANSLGVAHQYAAHAPLAIQHQALHRRAVTDFDSCASRDIEPHS